MNAERTAVFAVAAILLLAIMAGPVALLIATVPPPAVAAAFADPGVAGAARVSLGASALALVAATLLGVPAGYELRRWNAVPRSLALFALALPLAFPPIASGIVLLNVVGLRTALGAALAAHGVPLVDSFWGVSLAEFFVSGSFVAITSFAAFAALDPAYEEAAATLGASPLRAFLLVALPLAAPNVAAGILLAWLRAIGEYGATSVLAYHPTSLPVALYVTLSSRGVEAALAIAYGFVVLVGIVVGLQWAIRRHVV
ncbi:MAG: ABC transporter permease subunit [Candidatus Eremiobacteraeota bacterium]|nr:ABC transporter permease subunit [Candidatus Eremiobacteraeota bacterium]